jgi:septal ring factor EnvC (AmiA/AmiB activator)
MAQCSANVLFSLTLGLLLLTGCASRETTPTLADEMRGAAAAVQLEADRRAQLADDWERGQNLITSGQRKLDRGEQRVESAERDLERGRREVEEGQDELSEGRRVVAESERRFEELRRQEMHAPQPQHAEQR